MKIRILVNSLAILLLFLAAGCSGVNQAEETTEGREIPDKNEQIRIVSLSGSVSEILAECGLTDSIVGTDITSTFPEAIAALSKVGHSRNLSVEGVLALNPTHIIGILNVLSLESFFLKKVNKVNAKDKGNNKIAK